MTVISFPINNSFAATEPLSEEVFQWVQATPRSSYYFNKDKREERGHSLLNNTGSFVGFQSKMVFNKNVDDVLTNDIYFGQQLPLGKHWIYRYHVGLGLGFNLAQGFGVIYPTIGSSFGYSF